ncbi:hypothetical protein XhhCFBP4925_21995 [Xanthomonas hortorum pv. hederae]|nr:hypothetical protein XhhCFBP4925_21995 [Xanthomonas hortorum pv. hederae]PUE93575.1 hypothetical protein C7T87_22845 [Xanthomonas hortorum pv. hederae]
MHTDHLHWSLHAHRRGTLCGMDAAEELTGTYLQRVPRWWAGKGPAARPQISRPAAGRHEVVLLAALSKAINPIRRVVDATRVGRNITQRGRPSPLRSHRHCAPAHRSTRDGLRR